MKLYEGCELRFVGDVITVDEVAGDNQKQIEVVCSSPFWRLNHRLAGKSSTGFSRRRRPTGG